jgi:hypothetical protein
MFIVGDHLANAAFEVLAAVFDVDAAAKVGIRVKRLIEGDSDGMRAESAAAFSRDLICSTGGPLLILQCLLDGPHGARSR